jgi:hypothetical protein
MAAEPAIEFTVRARQKSDETYTIVVERAPGHWIAEVRLPDGGLWLMNRFDPRAPALPRQWAGASAAAAADYASRVLVNHFASEGIEIVRRTSLLPPG